MKKVVSFILMTGLLLGTQSCKDEIVNEDSVSLLKSQSSSKTIIENASNWCQINPRLNSYPLFESMDYLKWEQAVVHDHDSALIVEVPIKLKNKFETRVKGSEELNVEYRLLIIQKGSKTYSLLEFLISTNSKEKLGNSKEINYGNLKESFEGTLVMCDNIGNVVLVKEFGNEAQEVKTNLKSIQIHCLALVYNYSDGSYDVISILYCYETDSGTSSSGGSNPTNVDPDNCDCDICQVCGGCLSILKSIPIPGDDGDETEETYTCPMCSCTPVVDATGLQQNSKANCIYGKLLNGGILQDFITRYFAPSQQNQSFLGELNLTWTLGSTNETLPIGVPRNGTYYSVEIRMSELFINTASSTNVALSMFHEAIHAKLIAEFYDEESTTDFITLYAKYKGMDLLGMDKEQEKIMLNTYIDDLAIGLKNFDTTQGILKSLDFYKKAVRYDLIYEIYGDTSTQDDYNAYLELVNSSKNCN